MTLIRLIGGRAVLSLLTLLIVSALIFWILEVLPGDVASRIMGRDATPETLALLRAKLHLNDPAITRYLRWLGGMATGDFGTALTSSRWRSSIASSSRSTCWAATTSRAAMTAPAFSTMRSATWPIWRMVPLSSAGTADAG